MAGTSSSLANLRTHVQNLNAGLQGQLVGNMAISEMTHGISVTGAQAFLQEIKVDCIDKAIEALQQTDKITDVFRVNWQGRAEANFEINMNKAVALLATQLEKIKENIETQISDMIEDWAKQDEAMVALDDQIVNNW